MTSLAALRLCLKCLINSFNTWPLVMLELSALALLLREIIVGQVCLCGAGDGGDSTHEFDLRLAQCRK